MEQFLCRLFAVCILFTVATDGNVFADEKRSPAAEQSVPPEPATAAPNDPNSSGHQNSGGFQRSEFFGANNSGVPGADTISAVPMGWTVNRNELPAILCCDRNASGFVSYDLVNSGTRIYSYTIKPRQAQVLKEQGWQIRYRPTPESPAVIHRLQNGQFYQFRRETDGWRLFQVAENVP
ncbi:MAG: hypothetical protein R3C49_10030 [Planctomycetaceae bacterium]